MRRGRIAWDKRADWTTGLGRACVGLSAREQAACARVRVRVCVVVEICVEAQSLTRLPPVLLFLSGQECLQERNSVCCLGLFSLVPGGAAR
jgi:hypothetical protein